MTENKFSRRGNVGESAYINSDSNAESIDEEVKSTSVGERDAINVRGVITFSKQSYPTNGIERHQVAKVGEE